MKKKSWPAQFKPMYLGKLVQSNPVYESIAIGVGVDMDAAAVTSKINSQSNRSIFGCSEIDIGMQPKGLGEWNWKCSD